MTTRLLYTALSLSALLFFFSCRKDATVERKTIVVSDVNQLYAAVNDSTNAGAVIVLAAGTYTLVSTQPNGGRLELQKDMELRGQEGRSDLVVIDESTLPAASFSIPPSFRTGGIRMGRGSNSIEWLTVLGNAGATPLSAIDTDLTWPDIIHISISHLIVKGSLNGIDIRNPGFAGVNRVIEAEINDNEFVGNYVGSGQGMEIQNANGATGSIIRATLKGNYSHGNKLGLKSFNTGTNSGSITVQSTDDRFEDNGTGVWLAAGASTSATAIANGNTITFEAHGTSFRNNRGTNNADSTPPSGLFAAAGLSVAAGNKASDNKLEINLWKSPLSANQAADINAFGAYSLIAATAGTNNMTSIHLYDESRTATAVTLASFPAEAALTNTINIFR
jgi:hypothetical protein